MRKASLLLIAAVLTSCAGPDIERRTDARFVYGWTGIETQTTNPLDPYLEGKFVVKCPTVLNQISSACKLYGNMAGDSTLIIVNNVSVPDQDLAARLRYIMSEPIGRCDGAVVADVMTMGSRAYPYAFASCLTSEGNQYGLLGINRWGRTYFYQVGRKAPPVGREEMLGLVQDTRFPA